MADGKTITRLLLQAYPEPKIAEEFRGKVPATVDELATPAGVERKTANMVLVRGCKNDKRIQMFASSTEFTETVNALRTRLRVQLRFLGLLFTTEAQRTVRRRFRSPD